VASTCVAYLAFLFSGVRGLAQLSVFTVTGLAVAALTTRFLLPSLIPESSRDAADSARLGRLWHAIAGMRRPLWLGLATALACVAYLALSPRPLWENDLGALTPIPPALLARDSALRQELGAPDVRHLLVIEDSDAESVLRKAADLEPKLAALVARGVLEGYDQPARYLPAKSVQERRRAALPDADTLRASLNEALGTTPFKPGIFEPFLADVATARQLPALGPADLAGTPVEARISSLLLQREDHWTGLATLTGVNDAGAVAQVAAQVPGTTLLDLKQASEDLVAHQRERILWCLAVAAVLLVIVVFAALRDALRVRRVLAPMALTTLLIVALFHATGVSLSLFHLIALVLAAGLGLDYALFFEHAADDPAEQRRTLHAVIVCSLSTLLVFALLALSTLPVLRAIGLTVAAGVVSNFVLALLLTRPSKRTGS
jgi:predicted exporter